MIERYRRGVGSLGGRVEERLAELGWRQIDLLRKVPDLEKGTLSAMILRRGRVSEFSEEIAEALGVEHRWLQTGRGPKLRVQQWPFRRINKEELLSLPEDMLNRVEGYIEAVLEEHRKSGAKSVA